MLYLKHQLLASSQVGRVGSMDISEVVGNW